MGILKSNILFKFRLNSFSYGANFDFVESRLFPVILDEISNIFNMEQCSFTLSENRSRTARWAFYNELNCKLVYTIETSYFGFSKK